MYLNPINFVQVENQDIIADLVKYEEQISIMKKYKFGVLYVKDGQVAEDDMYSNGMPFMNCVSQHY